MFKDCNEVLGEIIWHLQNAKKTFQTSKLLAGGWLPLQKKSTPSLGPFGLATDSQ